MISKNIDLTLESWFAGDSEPELLLNEERQDYNNRKAYSHQNFFDRARKIYDLLIFHHFGIDPDVEKILINNDDSLQDWVEHFSDILDAGPKHLRDGTFYCYELHNQLYSNCECCGKELNLLNSNELSICESCDINSDGKLENTFLL